MSNKLEDIELRSEEVQDILSQVPSRMIRYGNVLFFSLIILILILSWIIKYPDIIPSEAIITTEIPPQKEYAKSTGKIEHLLVNNNQEVGLNQPLAILENPANYEDIFYLKSILDSIKPQRDRFEFPMDSLPILFLGDLETDFAVFQNNYIQYQLNRELNPFDNQETANRVTESELRARLALLENQRDLNKSELAYKEKELQRHKTLFERGVISSQEYEGKELEYLQAERNFRNLSVSLSQLRESISNARKNTRENRINKSTEELRLLKMTLQSFNQLKKSIRDWELQYAFVSNIMGKVSFINAWSENQAVEAGDFLFSIVPDQNSKYMAKLKTPSQNAGKIKRGQRVNIRVENFPDEEFGMLSGTVKNISLLPDREGNYLVDVALPERLITTYGKEITFTQEMRGSAEIITEDLRLLERLFYQFRKLLKNY